MLAMCFDPQIIPARPKLNDAGHEIWFGYCFDNGCVLCGVSTQHHTNFFNLREGKPQKSKNSEIPDRRTDKVEMTFYSVELCTGQRIAP